MLASFAQLEVYNKGFSNQAPVTFDYLCYV